MGPVFLTAMEGGGELTGVDRVEEGAGREETVVDRELKPAPIGPSGVVRRCTKSGIAVVDVGAAPSNSRKAVLKPLRDS